MLGKSDDHQITNDEFIQVKEMLQTLLDSGLSPHDIKCELNLTYSDFGMFLKKSFGLQLKTVRDAVINFNKNAGKLITDEKRRYYQECKFTFDPYRYNFIPGFQLLLEHGMYHSINNPNGVCRDHMMSKIFGWTNKIDPSIISHPANCQFLLASDNNKKNSSSCVSLQELTDRINQWDSQKLSDLNFRIIPTAKSQEHRRKLSEANKKVWERRKANPQINQTSRMGRKPITPAAELLAMIEQYGPAETSKLLGISRRMLRQRKQKAIKRLSL
jgi:hypothetical protein